MKIKKFYIRTIGTILLFSFFAVMSTNISSCSNKDTENSTTIENESVGTKSLDTKSEVLIKQYDIYGQEHNRILQEFITELADNGYKNMAEIQSNKSKAKSIVMESASKLLRSYQPVLEKKGLSSSAAEEVISQTIQKLKNTRTFPKSLTEDYGYPLSPNQKEMLAQMDNMLRKGRNPKEVFEKMNWIAKDAIKILPEQELQRVLITSSVAKYSYQFWYDYLGMESQVKTRAQQDLPDSEELVTKKLLLLRHPQGLAQNTEDVMLDLIEFALSDAMAAAEAMMIPICWFIPELAIIYGAIVSNSDTYSIVL